MHNPNHVLTAGAPLETAQKAMIMVHGRGASAQSILSLADYIDDKNVAYLAPQATQGTWYPYSFLAPTEQNEPGLSSGLEVIRTLVERLHQENGFKYSDIYLLGFSQGACLSLEFAARHPQPYGGVFGLSGGLIGPDGAARHYEGTLEGTPVFLGCSDVDSHIPKSRVLESEQVFKAMKASVLVKLYPNFAHTINDDELTIVNQVLANTSF
ncbi:dienelactone hydrolase family protein [Rhabdobacter roseus]|uniref:Putative esterase n=1 Tax=Rhabdobacter roseus TaxID=1655419 RepID=A0A840U0S5_9BACT|nr:dienelactone hydrolase family protein [Rhabdobacter roseus]MBB5287357.1 putative esterase [Rhabdobacter roseus]